MPAKPNISVFTGGALGTLGGQPGNDIALNGTNTVSGNILVMGPGNGAERSTTAEVPMSETGTAERLFVRVNNDPGTSMNVGTPGLRSSSFCARITASPGPAACLHHHGTRHDLQRPDGYPGVHSGPLHELVGLRHRTRSESD